MIEKIKSLKSDFNTINLINKFSREIYNIDSINLIIGDNGSGKTQLIKSIISDITSEYSPDEYIASGNFQKLGIIYYTGVPFHSKLKINRSSNIRVIDASLTYKHRSTFSKMAIEYLNITKELGIKQSSISVARYNIRDIISKSLKILAQEGSRITDEIGNYCDLYDEYNKLTKERDKIYGKGQFVAKENLNINIQYINEKIEYKLHQMMIAEGAIISKILDRLYYNNFGSDEISGWISLHLTLNERHRKKDTYYIIKYIIYLLTQDISAIYDLDKTSNNWMQKINNIKSFLDIISHNHIGNISLKEEYIETTAKLDFLLSIGVDDELINSFHKLDLIDLNFNSHSSGEAAILHQIICISSAIHSLSKNKYSNILVFIDEGDMLLHLAWQRKYLDLLDQKLGSLKVILRLDSIQLIVATHSPLLATDILKDSILRLPRKDGEIPTFGAPLQKIVNYSFGVPSVGLIAERKINDLKQKTVYSSHDRELISQIDDDFIRYHLLKKK